MVLPGISGQDLYKLYGNVQTKTSSHEFVDAFSQTDMSTSIPISTILDFLGHPSFNIVNKVLKNSKCVVTYFFNKNKYFVNTAN